MLGTIIQLRRKRRKLSQTELAAAIGMPGSQTYVSAVERGDKGQNITQDVLNRFADALYMPVTILTAAWKNTLLNQPPLDLLHSVKLSNGDLQGIAEDWPDYTEEERLQIIMNALDAYQGQQEAERLSQEQREAIQAIVRHRKTAV